MSGRGHACGDDKGPLTPSIQHVADDVRLMTGLQENLRSRQPIRREDLFTGHRNEKSVAWRPSDLNVSWEFSALVHGPHLLTVSITSDTGRLDGAR